MTENPRFLDDGPPLLYHVVS